MRLGEYTLEEPLGEGGFATVWRVGHHLWPERKAAAKVLRDKAHAQQLKAEADCLSRLAHPGIARAIGIDLDSDPPYLLIELHEGQTLRQLLNAETKLSPAKAFSIFSQLVAALAHSHGKGITHGDLKPENVLLDSAGRVKLGDFGLGRIRASEASLMLSGAMDTQEDASLAGTIPYMAPEQRDGAQVDPTSDVFSLGILLHEMLTGKRPQPGDDPRETLEDPPKWIDVWEKCYTRRDRRLKSAVEVASAMGIGASGGSGSGGGMLVAPRIKSARGPWTLEQVEHAVAQEMGLSKADLLHPPVADGDSVERMFSWVERQLVGEESERPLARSLVWVFASQYLDVPYGELAERYNTSVQDVRNSIRNIRYGRSGIAIWRGVIDRLAPLPPSFLKKAKQADSGKVGRALVATGSFFASMLSMVSIVIVAFVSGGGAITLLPVLLAALFAWLGTHVLQRRRVLRNWVEAHLDEVPGATRLEKLTILGLHAELPIAAASRELLAAEAVPDVRKEEEEEEEIATELEDESSTQRRRDAEAQRSEAEAEEPPEAPGIDVTLEAVRRAMAESEAEAAAEAEAEAEAAAEPEPRSEPEPEEELTAKDAKDAKEDTESPLAPLAALAVESSSSPEPEEPRMPLDEAMRQRDGEQEDGPRRRALESS